MSPTNPVSEDHSKPCTLCHTPRHVLVRCQIDTTGKWHFVCPGKCWKSVSGGVEDAKGREGEFPNYRYGGMWKNKHADGPVSAKKPKKVKERQKREAAAANAANVDDYDGEQGCESTASEGEAEDQREIATNGAAAEQSGNVNPVGNTGSST